MPPTPIRLASWSTSAQFSFTSQQSSNSFVVAAAVGGGGGGGGLNKNVLKAK